MAVDSEQNGMVSVQNSAEIVFVDEDDFPLANLMEHVQSDDDLDNDFELIQDEEEAVETPNRTLRVPRGRRNENTEWRRNINLRPDLDFDQPTGPRFLEVYNPERNLSIDETLIKFKGKIYFRQFIPIKPGRFGIKCFTLAEASSGYGLVSKIYTGKENGVVQTDLGRKSVMGLMEAFFDKGYKLYMDNYYTSVPLFEDLERRGTLACGTVRSNRKGLPKDITNVHNEEIKGLKRGESVYRQKDTITCVGWKDSKMVYMLATTPVNPACNSEVERSVKEGNKWQKIKSISNEIHSASESEFHRGRALPLPSCYARSPATELTTC